MGKPNQCAEASFIAFISGPLSVSQTGAGELAKSSGALYLCAAKDTTAKKDTMIPLAVPQAAETQQERERRPISCPHR